MALQVMYAGQDVSLLVQEKSIQIQDTLGQGAGVTSSSSGRATTCTFLISGLGPAASAVGAGTTISSPKLVRHGELIIYDSTSTAIFGGYAMVLEDQTVKKTNYVKVSCVDYWQYLENIVVNKVYLEQTDIFVINDLLTTYAPWLDVSLLPSTPSLTLAVENFTHFTLRKALQRVTDKTGYIIWIDPTKHVRYANPTTAPTAPFALSDTPNFTTSFQMGVDDYQIDDTAAINRVYFYGGKNLSGDLTQDLTNQADGTNDLFVLAYYPHKASDGNFHLKVNGTDVNLGFVGSTGASNTLVQDGGSANALLNIDSHTIQWDSGSIPTGAVPVTFVYRREIPLLVVVADNASKNFFGAFLDGVISDASVFDQATAIRRCRTLLLEQSFGLETLQLRTWRAGIQAGQIIRVDHTVRNIHKTFVVQQVSVAPQGGGGFFEYKLQLGAWNLNLVDLVMQLARNATPDDESSTEQEVTVAIEDVTENVGFNLAVTTTDFTMGMFYPRATPVGDGHDLYPGLASI